MAKNIPKGTRKIHGERFTYVATTHTKSTAKWKAAGLREDGLKIRIVPVAAGYRLYKRG